jgi:hypothetical protein
MVTLHPSLFYRLALHVPPPSLSFTTPSSSTPQPAFPLPYPLKKPPVPNRTLFSAHPTTHPSIRSLRVPRLFARIDHLCCKAVHTQDSDELIGVITTCNTTKGVYSSETSVCMYRLTDVTDARAAGKLQAGEQEFCHSGRDKLTNEQEG